MKTDKIMKTMALSSLVRRWIVATVLVIVGLLGGRTSAWADDVIPKVFPADRYAKMGAHSPFTPPTVQAAPVAAPTPPPGPSWGDKLSVTSLVEDGGTYKATVLDPDQTEHIYLQSDRAYEPLQMQIASVKWPKSRDDQPGVREAPVITIRKGTEFATVRYEPGGGGAAGVPTGMPGGINRAFIPGNAGVRPPGAAGLAGRWDGLHAAASADVRSPSADDARNGGITPRADPHGPATPRADGGEAGAAGKQHVATRSSGRHQQ